MTGKQLTAESPLILLGSGASRSVCGVSRLKWWYQGEQFELKKSARSFRFGAGPLIQSSGTVIIFIHANSDCTDPPKPLVLPICVDVVDSHGPMLVSYESLGKMKGPLGFSEAILAIVSGIKIKLAAIPSWHLAIRGKKANVNVNPKIDENHESVFAMEIRLPVTSLSLDDVKRIHLQLGHCSENTMVSVLRDAQMHGGKSLIGKIFSDCKCQVAVQRITPPNVAFWLSKYNGEIVVLGVIFPFRD